MSSNAHAQSQLISGTVVDQSGGMIPGASVKVIDETKAALVREVITDENGRFQALNIQPGSYSLTVEAPGFKKLTRSNVNLEVNTRLDVGELKLTLGEVTETVQVTDIPVLVQTNTMEKAYLVESTQIRELPLNGRNWVALMNTVPGVTSTTRSDFETNFNDVSGFHANGGRGSQNNFYLDGSPNLDVGDNQSQYTQPSVYSIGEFKMQQSSFNAEYGRNSGIVVAVQTKSGGSDFHGTLYEYVRNDAFDAKRHDLPATASKDKLRYNLFGGILQRLGAHSRGLDHRQQEGLLLLQSRNDTTATGRSRAEFRGLAQRSNAGEWRFFSLLDHHGDAVRSPIQRGDGVPARVAPVG